VKGPLETKDYFTIGLSTAALLVSLSSAIFSYRQFDLNRERDLREQQKAADDAAKEFESHNPLIHFEVKRDGTQRRFVVKVSFENRGYAAVQITSVNFWSDIGLLIAPSRYQPGDLAVFPEYKELVSHSNVISEGLPTMPVSGRADWYCFIVVPDSAALIPHTLMTFTFSIKFRDVHDTTTTIRRDAELP
jgi:hypothetical protein